MIELRWKWQTVDVDDYGNPQKKKVLQYRQSEGQYKDGVFTGWKTTDWMDVPTVTEED